MEAEDGESGLVCVAQYQPDIVLLDLGLPNMAGLRKKLRTHDCDDWIRTETGRNDVTLGSLLAVSDVLGIELVGKSPRFNWTRKRQILTVPY